MRRFLSVLLTATALILGACAHTPSRPMAGASGSSTSGTASGAQSAGAPGASSNESAGAQGAQSGAAIAAPFSRTIHFAFNSSVINTQGTTIVAANAKYLVAHPAIRVRLEGNTDDRGSPEYNIALGWRRAESVRQAMLLQGVSASQMTMVSYGEERPVDPHNNRVAWAKNRRVDIRYLN